MDKTEKLIDWEDNERSDRNRNGIDDDIEPPIPDVSNGSAKLAARFRENPGMDPTLAGGDIDAQWEMAESTGDDSAGGSMPGPDQNDTGDIAKAIGITYDDNEPLKVGEKERSRDLHRWELDPASSEDYRDRLKDEER
jgi:hypothetical protein